MNYNLSSTKTLSLERKGKIQQEQKKKCQLKRVMHRNDDNSSYGGKVHFLCYANSSQREEIAHEKVHFYPYRTQRSELSYNPVHPSNKKIKIISCDEFALSVNTLKNFVILIQLLIV
jgi:hypothetical protein